MKGSPPIDRLRWTGYIVYPDDPAALALDNDALAHLAQTNQASVEEIDSDAATYDAAWKEIERVAKRDYEPGGRLVYLLDRGW